MKQLKAFEFRTTIRAEGKRDLHIYSMFEPPFLMVVAWVKLYRRAAADVSYDTVAL